MLRFLCLQVFALTIFAVTALNAQIKTPQPSPASKITQTIGMTEVEVEYSRPGVKGRTIFAADGLVPYGKVWRTGANKNTTISFDKNVVFGGVEVKKGTYALFVTPSSNTWKVQLYTDTNNWGTPKEWDENKVAANVEATVIGVKEKIENFVILFDELTNNSGNMYLGWENSMVGVEIKVSTMEEAKASIEKALAGPDASSYYSAASYYLDEKIDLKQAYTWIKKANDLTSDSPKFWMLRRQALIEHALGDKKAAIMSAKKSLEYAKKAGYEGYIKSNEKSIKEWSK